MRELDRSELIRQLGMTFQEEAGTDGNSANDLEEELHMSQGDIARMKRVEGDMKKQSRHILAMEMEEFSDILLGRRSFLVTKDLGFIQGDSLVVRGYDNLRPTGEMLVKIVTRVEKDVEGLVPGYCVVSWE